MSERVLSGKASRRAGEPWKGPVGVPARPEQARDLPEDPMAHPVVLARIDEAQRQAMERGYVDGRTMAEQQFNGIIAATQGMSRALETAVPRDVEMVARTVAELAVLVARRILAAELRHDPAVLVAAIEAGMRQTAGASVITVELHPSAVQAVEQAWTARHGARHRGFTWAFSADPTLPVGGCRLRTEHGFVEAGFEDQLAEVAAALDAAIPGYIGAALGPGTDAAASSTQEPVAAAVPTLRPAGAAGLAPTAHLAAPSPDPEAAADPLAELVAAAGFDPAALDLEALASLGLDLGPEELA